MFGSAAYGETQKRTLEQADVDGFISIYGAAGTTLTAPVLTSPVNGATGVTSTPVLSWGTVSNATSYDVYFGSSSTLAFAATVASTSWQPGTLIAGGAYSWQVVAKSSAGSAGSGTSAFTVAAAPTPTTTSGPTLLSPAYGSTVNGQNPVFQWTSVSGATSYEVYVGSAGGALSQVAVVSGTSVTVKGLKRKTVYAWKVIARTPSGALSSATGGFQTN
jgi:hypothetical protein